MIMCQLCQCGYLTLQPLTMLATVSVNQLDSNQLIGEDIFSKIDVRHATACNWTQQAIMSDEGRWFEYLHDVSPFVYTPSKKEHDQA